MAAGAALSQFPLIGIVQRVQHKRFVNVQLAKPLPPGPMSILLSEKYICSERLLEKGESKR